MLSISELKKLYNEIKQSPSTTNYDNLNLSQEQKFQSLAEFISSKFGETSSVFSKFDNVSLYQFCQESSYDIFEENANVFKKNDKCDSYYFIIYGDLNFYDEEITQIQLSNKLLKTVSAGTIYGHKIKSHFNFFAYAKTVTHLIKISNIIQFKYLMLK